MVVGGSAWLGQGSGLGLKLGLGLGFGLCMTLTASPWPSRPWPPPAPLAMAGGGQPVAEASSSSGSGLGTEPRLPWSTSVAAAPRRLRRAVNTVAHPPLPSSSPMLYAVSNSASEPSSVVLPKPSHSSVTSSPSPARPVCTCSCGAEAPPPMAIGEDEETCVVRGVASDARVQGSSEELRIDDNTCSGSTPPSGSRLMPLGEVL
jgi:hypothetical protein